MADNNEMTVEQLDALLKQGQSQPAQQAPVQQPQPQQASSSQLSVEDLNKLTQKPEAPAVGFGEDIARSAGAGFGRGALSLAGLPGDLRNVVELGLQKTGLGSLGTRYVPTSEEVIAKTKETFPSLAQHLDYKPEYKPSKFVKSAAEFLPSAIIPGGGLGLGARAAGAVGAGLASQAAENYFQGTPAEGSGWETAAKVAASVPGYMLGTKALSAGQGLVGGVLRPGAEAERRLASTMAKDVVSGGKYGAPMTPIEAGKTGAPMTAASIAGTKTQKLIDTAAQRVKPEVAGSYEAAIAPIKEGAPRRINEYLNQVLNITDDNIPFKDIAAIRSRASVVNSQNYKDVMSLPHAQKVGGDDLIAVVNRLPQGVIGTVADDLRQWGIDPLSVGLMRGRGGWKLNAEGMPLRFWDEVKTNLDQQIRALKDNVTGKITNESDFARLNDINKKLKEALDSKVSEYAGVRSIAAGFQGAASAIDLGSKYLTVTKPEQRHFIEKTISKFTPEQKMDFAQGVVGSYKDLLTTDPAAAMKLFTGSKGGDRIRRFNEALLPLGDNVGYELVGRVNAELLNSQLKSLRPSDGFSIKPGLVPYATGAAGAAIQLGEMLLQPALWSGNPTALMTAVAGWGLGKLYNAKEARIAAKVLEYSSDPSKLDRLGKLMATSPEAQTFLTKTTNLLGRAVAPALVSETEPREGRATGGKVTGSIAQRLIAAAEKAHKYHQKTTEEILDAPDEHVVKALAVANKNI